MSVTIVIPVYNAEDYLVSTLDSCLAQDASVLKEIIVIDDRSTDRSKQIIERYTAEHPGLIKHLSNTGSKGAPAARNLGIKHASGTYIQFLDADDVLSENKLSAQFNALMNKSTYAVSSCSWCKFHKDTSDAQVRKQTIDKSYDTPWEWLIDSWSGKGMGQTGIWLVSKQLVAEVNGFDESLAKNQDGDFFTKILLRAQSIEFCEEAMVYYRDRTNNSVSKSKSAKAAWSVLKSYKAYEDILNFTDIPKVRQALCRNYYRFVYQHYNKYPDLAIEAMNRAKHLGFKAFEYQEFNSLFSTLSKGIGYKNTFRLRNLLRGF